ncbi:hypothetical protein DMB92_06030 [Campylobacter sp. MIT 99-7217]|uniref:major outer membrane protein n=1 Tax=Campylobacter sp. MIT 99-7217 TaxID=535091 RepID=UPI00115B3857|nr:major outer membrane protein [Campylobacter sp. MIT 99-7217]TQR31935.1 hypothetical protein DMB92_06030 [Campylobacter sp. MIT 99-7217]
MKLVKLSLVAALAAGSLSALNAVSLEDAIKNVDFTGNLRYRYDTASDVAAPLIGQSSTATSKQSHKIRARLGVKASIADDFKVFGQAQYGESANGGYGPTTNGNSADTQRAFNLRQAYLEYTNSDYATSVIVGRQELGTIWTDDMVGIAGKLVNTSIEGVTLAAFWVDGFEVGDGERAFANNKGGASAYQNVVASQVQGTGAGSYAYVSDFFYRQNLYGAAAITSFDLGGSSLDAQVWFGYMQKRATLYALDVKYGLDLAEDLKWNIRASYLGNSLDSALKDKLNNAVDNGMLYRVDGTIKGYGFDGTLGYVSYGKDDKVTVNTVEDQNSIGLLGKELFYAEGSRLTDALGKSAYTYVGAGYTLPQDIRIGAQYVFGSTKAGHYGVAAGGGKKSEIVGELSYNYNKNLGFLAYYSYLDASSDVPSGVDSDQYKKSTVRLQALYKF